MGDRVREACLVFQLDALRLGHVLTAAPCEQRKLQGWQGAWGKAALQRCQDVWLARGGELADRGNEELEELHKVKAERRTDAPHRGKQPIEHLWKGTEVASGLRSMVSVSQSAAACHRNLAARLLVRQKSHICGVPRGVRLSTVSFVLIQATAPAHVPVRTFFTVSKS